LTSVPLFTAMELCESLYESNDCQVAMITMSVLDRKRPIMTA